MKSQEHTTWVREYTAGANLHEIAARYAVPYWRVRNAVIWSDELAAISLKRYKAKVPAIRAALLENPNINPDMNGLGISPLAFRAVRYALILKNEVPNTTRYSRRITIQEETRIQQLATMSGEWRRVEALARTTGRRKHQQAYIAARVIGERISHYRRNSGYSLRGISDFTGLPYGTIQKFINRGVLKYPFTDEGFFEFIANGGAMYESLNHCKPEYREIIAHYRNEYRIKYISKKYIADTTYTVAHSIKSTMARNGIPRALCLHEYSRVWAYDRALVARYYATRYGNAMAAQLREYSNDWEYLKCDWYTW